MSQTVRIGLIGVGGMMRQHVRQILPLENVEIVALCDTVPTQIAKAKEEFSQLADAAVFTDYHDLLALPEVDAVVIATPHTQHIQQANDAIDANKHILMEKPMVCEVVHAKSLLTKLEGYPKVFALAYQRHAQDTFKYMRDRIQSGELGTVQFLCAQQCQQWKKGTKGSWRQDPALSGGGQLNDSGSHLLDILLWMTGLTVREVAAFADNSGTPVDINSALSIRFTNGAQGNISVMGDALNWNEEMTIWCEKGTFFYRNGELDFCDESGKRTKVEKSAMPTTETIDQNFITAIRENGTPAAPPLCGLRTIELTEAAWKSAEQGGIPVRMN